MGHRTVVNPIPFPFYGWEHQASCMGCDWHSQFLTKTEATIKALRHEIEGGNPVERLVILRVVATANLSDTQIAHKIVRAINTGTDGDVGVIGVNVAG